MPKRKRNSVEQEPKEKQNTEQPKKQNRQGLSLEELLAASGDGTWASLRPSRRRQPVEPAVLSPKKVQNEVTDDQQGVDNGVVGGDPTMLTGDSTTEKGAERASGICITGSSSLSLEDKKQVNALANRFKSPSKAVYKKGSTYVVTGADANGSAIRSINCAYAIASGSWLVSAAWAQASMLAERLVEPGPYELFGPDDRDAPTRSRLSRRRIFEGFNMHPLEPMAPLQIMLVLAGASIAASPSSKRFNVTLANMEDTPEMVLLAKEHMKSSRRLIVSYHWAISSIFSYRLLPIWDYMPDVEVPRGLKSSYPSPMFDKPDTAA